MIHGMTMVSSPRVEIHEYVFSPMPDGAAARVKEVQVLGTPGGLNQGTETITSPTVLDLR
jgi:hypothetical protein